jgi:hypothetical protein
MGSARGVARHFSVGIELPVLMAVVRPLLGITSHAENVDATSE